MWAKKINDTERIEIYKYLGMWYEAKDIGVELWRNRRSIEREIERNSVNGKYKPQVAQKLYEQRRIKANHKHRKLVKDFVLHWWIVDKLKNEKEDWSPDTIVHRLEIEWRRTICTKTLYNHIHECEPLLARYLRHKSWWYKPRWNTKWMNRMKNVPLIEERPKVVDERKSIWDWEVDSVIWKDHKSSLATLTERMSRYLLIRRQKSLEAYMNMYLLIEALWWKVVKTITSDNWVEFEYLDKVGAMLKVKVYRCHPYASWEKWSCEKNNGELRQYMPKWTDFSLYSDEEILTIQNKINRKPRKILGYRSAEEVFFGKNYKLF